MMNGGMDSVMVWMMGIGPLGWVLLIALLVVVVFLLVRLVSREDRDSERGSSNGKSGTTRSQG